MFPQEIKMESIRKLSNFNFQSTKTLYQNNLNNIGFFLQFSRANDTVSYLYQHQTLLFMEARENKCQISQELRKHR